MNIINIYKQKIVNIKNELYAYELLFKDQFNYEASFSDNVKGTSQLIISLITSTELDQLLGQKNFSIYQRR